MAAALGSFKGGLGLVTGQDSDWFDRLSTRYSVSICLMFSLFVGAGRYAASRIACWPPADIGFDWARYAQQYCFIKNTYYAPLRGKFPDHASRDDLEIAYYQWIPIMLAIQAALFVLPAMVWKVLSAEGGSNLSDIVKECKAGTTLATWKRAAKVDFVARHMEYILGYRNRYNQDKHGKSALRKVYGWFSNRNQGTSTYLLTAYMITKACYIVLAIIQIIVLQSVISPNKAMFGITALEEAMSDRHPDDNGPGGAIFPRITFCDFDIRQMGGNIHRYTIQCVLPWNVMVEKMYIFLWFWLIFVIVMSGIGALTWIIAMFVPDRNHRFVHRHLALVGLTRDDDRFTLLMDKFVRKYLKADGMFVIRMVSKNTTSLVTSELLATMWKHYLETFAPTSPNLGAAVADEFETV